MFIWSSYCFQILFLDLIVILSKTVSTKLGHNLKFYKKPWMGFLYSYMLSEKGRLSNNNNEHKKTILIFKRSGILKYLLKNHCTKIPIWYEKSLFVYLVAGTVGLSPCICHWTKGYRRFTQTKVSQGPQHLHHALTAC